ncbi:hemolysin activation/secretion-like protein (plasmid) [Pseudomonas sp. FeN3W]|nr:hemolysin activation/secretion-like protein [Pseudomonas sp. FeN3W]
MRYKMALAGALLATSLFAHATPVIKGNTMIQSAILDRHIANARSGSYEEVARLIVSVYEQFGYVGVKAIVQDNVITIVEPGSSVEGDYDDRWLSKEEGQVLDVETINDSMAMADVNNRFGVLDVAVGDLRQDGSVGVSMKREQSSKPYAASVSYSSHGQDASARDLVTVSGGTHVGGGVRVDGAYTHGASSLRDESKGGEYRSVYVNAKKATPYGEFNASVSDSHNKVGGKDATRYDYELAGDTRRYSAGHRYVVKGVGTLSNSLNWVKRDQDFGLFGLSESQDYKSWNSRYYGKFGAHQFNASFTQGLGGRRDFNMIPLMGEFNPNFHAIQLGYATSGVFANQALGYGVSGSIFNGSKDMPSSERMSLGGPGRGSSHNNGVVSGYKGYFAEARLYGMNNLSPVHDLSLKPYLSLNGGQTTDAIGTDIEIYAVEGGILAKWNQLSGGVSYSDSIKTKNVEADARTNLMINYDF